jgi:hypothetical protein
MSRYVMVVEYSRDRTTKKFKVFDTEMNCYVGVYGGSRKDRLQCLYAIERLNEGGAGIGAYILWIIGLALFMFLFSQTL